MLTFEQMEATLQGGGVRVVSAPQLFPTPSGLAARMVEGIEPGASVLEPSAGTGSLLAALPAGVVTTAVEINHELAGGLNAGRVVCSDFLECTPDELGLFDWVVANPPFTKNRDVRHIRHMWNFLRPGGHLVTLSGVGWTFGSRRVQVAFREWLDELGAVVEAIERGTFTSTQVATRLIRAVKK